MTNRQLVAEIRRLTRLLRLATKAAVAQGRIIDKLTAAQLHVQLLTKELGRGR